MKYLLSLAVIILSACQPGLERQPKIGVLAEPRSPIAGTIAYAPKDSETPKITRDLVNRGKERYAIYCSVCHGLSGDGNGLATQRGFGAPLPFSPRSEKSSSLSQIEHVIAQGDGRMYPFANRIDYNDRYAIAAYTQILILRRHFPTAKLTNEDRTLMSGAKP